jgi:hypothetical protein
MASPTQQANWTIAYLQVEGSAIEGPHNAVTIGGKTAVGKESIQDAEAWGAPGIVFRPRPPEKIGTGMVGAEAVAARTGERLRPLAWRDLRFNRAFPAPKAGTVALVGYGGGFLSFDDTQNKQTLATLRVPYDFSGSTANKRHTITLDPEAETITVEHGDGGKVTLKPNGTIELHSDGSTSAVISPGKFEVTATQINLIGTVSAGDASGTTPVALLSDVQALTTFAGTHVHGVSSFGPTTPPSPPPAGPLLPTPAGSTKLKAL